MHDSSPSKDLLVELRKKARRRLVGAIVLALLIVTILPLFLESDPKPLGEDVQIDIPAISERPSLPNSNPISTNLASSAPTSPQPNPHLPQETVVAAAPVRNTDLAGPQNAETANTKLATSDHASSPQAEVPTTSAKEDKTNPPPKSAADSPNNKISDTEKKPTKTNANALPAGNPSAHTGDSNLSKDKEPAKKSEQFWVQLGVFSNSKKAQNVLEKARKLGFHSTLEKTTAEKNTATKVKVGPYVNRAAAETARDQLKEAGLTGFIIAP